MSKTQHIYALFEREHQAVAAYHEVQEAGCHSDHCSAIMHERHLDESALTGEERAGREGARKGAVIGGLAGATIGGLVVLGGGFIGVGPLAAAAFAGGAMAIFGGLLGGISASDEPEAHLRALQAQIEHGNILIAVETDDPEQEKKCEAIFDKHGGRQVVA